MIYSILSLLNRIRVCRFCWVNEGNKYVLLCPVQQAVCLGVHWFVWTVWPQPVLLGSSSRSVSVDWSPGPGWLHSASICLASSQCQVDLSLCLLMMSRGRVVCVDWGSVRPVSELSLRTMAAGGDSLLGVLLVFLWRCGGGFGGCLMFRGLWSSIVVFTILF